MTTPKIERRSVGASLRADSSKFELAGTAVAYNQLSSDLGGFRERFLPGAFARCLRSNPEVKCLFNHNSDVVLGRTQNGTLTLQDGPDGLRFVCKLNEASQAHRDLHASISRGDINECSFAFTVAGKDGQVFEMMDDNPADDNEEDEDSNDESNDEAGSNDQPFVRRTVRAANLFDVSAVTNPAYPQGTSVQARSVNYQIGKRSSSVIPDEREEFRRRLAAIDDKFANRQIDADHRERLLRIGREINGR